MHDDSRMATAFFDWAERQASVELFWSGMAKCIAGQSTLPKKRLSAIYSLLP